MDQSTRTAVVAAAVTAAGPKTDYTAAAEDGTVVHDAAAYQAAIHEAAVGITVMASESSALTRYLNSVEGAKVFSGTVMAVKKEQSSTRGVITLHTGTDRTKDGVPAGCEQVRTDRTDGAIGRAMALRVRGLIGHRVLVWVDIEEYNQGAGKVRVIKHVESQGVDAEFASKQSA